MLDLNNCTIEYMKNGKRTKQRAIKHLSGQDLEDPNTYVIVTAKSRTMQSNTTNDSLYKYITNKFKNDRDTALYQMEDILDKYKNTMPKRFLDELEVLEAKHKKYIKKTNCISPNAQAFELLNGRVIDFIEMLIPKENFVKKNVDNH